MRAVGGLSPTRDDLRELAYVLVGRGAKVLETFTIALVFEPNHRLFPAVRDFAWCEDGDPPTVVLSTKLLAEPEEVAYAILAHEIGHALDFAAGNRAMVAALREAGIPAAQLGPERRADVLGSMLIRKPIRYDERGVQTLGPGDAVRPTRLGR